MIGYKRLVGEAALDKSGVHVVHQVFDMIVEFYVDKLRLLQRIDEHRASLYADGHALQVFHSSIFTLVPIRDDQRLAKTKDKMRSQLLLYALG